MESEVGTLVSKVVAEVALTADTEIQICTWKKGFDLTIKELTWTFGNVVNAKAATGYLEVKLGNGDTPYRYPIGFGVGGATNASNQYSGSLDVVIPVPKSTSVTIYATMTENCVSGFCSAKYIKGLSGKPTYGDCNTAEDAAVTADTLETTATITMPPDKGGTIKKILCALANVVDAKAVGGYLDLEFSGSGKGSQRYVIGGGTGGAATTSHKCGAQEIDVDIPNVLPNETITISIYLAEAAVNVHTGVLWV